MISIGIDPGKAGGIAVLGPGGQLATVVKMPATERDVLDLFLAWNASSSHATLERVASSPQMGVVSAFSFGKTYGGLRMALAAAQIPFDEVAPGVWQRTMGCLSKGDKNVTKRRAQELFPGVTVTHATADALLIAMYGYRVQVRL